MKKFAVVLAAVLAIAAIPAMAASVGNPNYHYGANMNCSDCHSMHASAHLNMTTGAAITTPNATGGVAINPYYPAPNPGPGRAKLLKNADVCASCHDGQTFAPDVVAVNTNNSYARSAGKVGTLVDAIGGGHIIGSTVLPPGYDNSVAGYYTAAPAGGLECVSCHSPHGSSNFRNLVPYQMRTAAGANATLIGPQYNKSVTWDNLEDVQLKTGPWTFPSVFADYYGRDNIVYTKLTTPVTFDGASSSNRMDAFCAVCHGAFHGGAITELTTVGNGTDFVRHPTSTVTLASVPTYAGQTIAAGNLRLYQVNATQTMLASDSPGCITCHKAHGSANPFGLVYPSYTAAATNDEAGESGGTGGVYKNLCKTCHSMGGTF